jgi:cold shock CspA family protein
MTHTALEVDSDNAKLAIVRGKYDIYPVGQSAFVQNIYALITETDTSPLLGLRLLRLLEDTSFQRAEGMARYVEVPQIRDYFAAMNIEPRVTNQWLEAMLNYGLVLSYDPTVSGIEKAFRVEIAPAGLQHLQWGLGDWIYMESMAEVTPLLEQAVHDNIRGLLGVEMPFARRKAVRTFLLYLLGEDSKYCVIPDHATYGPQSGIRSLLEHECVKLFMPMMATRTKRYGRPFGKVVEWKSDRGFGFIDSGASGAGKVFVHVNDLLDEDATFLAVGTLVEYDLRESDRGPRAFNVAVLP